MKSIKFAILLIITIFAASCNSSKTVLPLFVDISDVQEGEFSVLDGNIKIQPNDELIITITSSVPEASLPYNYTLLITNYGVVNNSANLARQLTYRVDKNGDITMPVLGEMHVAGETINELEKRITNLVRKDISDATVKVELVNFYVNILGEVNRPSRINITGDRFSLLDAIAAAGDLTSYGERSNILIIREEDGKRVFKHIDLNSSDVFSSPYFYLQQNDYIYVEPNNVKQSNSRYDTNNAYRLQVIATVVSASSVIASLIIALVVK